MKPIRIQLRRKKGFRLPPNTINVARPGKWGNPYKIGVDGTREEVIDLFRHHHGMFEQFSHSQIKKELRGKNLACWCPLDKACHASILLEIANT